jgi:hypothetical protein
MQEGDGILNDLKFPLIAPFIEHLKQEKGLPEKVLIVHTDQEDADERHRSNDTLYFSEIFRRWLIIREGMQESQIDSFAVTRSATDIDRLYKSFKAKGQQLTETNGGFENVYLLAQGGIDQINHALTLQLIQLFKNRVRHYQVPENGIPQQLNFPSLFLVDLAKQNMIKHAADNDFEKLDASLCSEKWIIQLSEYASDHLALRHSNKSYENKRVALDAYRKITGKDPQIPVKELKWDKLQGFEKNKIKLRDLYIAMKIKYHQGNYNDFIWRTFTLLENLHKCEIDEHYRKDSKYTFNAVLKPEDTNEKFREFLEKIQEGLHDELKNNGIYVHNPTRRAYKFVYERLVEKNEIIPKIDPGILQKIESVIDEWAKRRNGVAHKLGTIRQSEIDAEISKYFSSPDEFFKQIDRFMDVTGLGEYDMVRKIILEHYK